MKETIEGRVAAQEADDTTGVSDSAVLLYSAREMMKGVHVLAQSDAQVACALLAGQTLECVLKSYLAHKGIATDKLIGFGHDLVRLWESAAAYGLTLDPKPPQWCTELHGLYAGYPPGQKPRRPDRPAYYLRYPTKQHGFLLKPISSMTSELQSVVDSVDTLVSS
jgi:hypothetical protein